MGETVSVGDVIHVESFVYDRWESATGPVEKIAADPAGQLVTIEGRHFLLDASPYTTWTIVERATPQPEPKLPDWAVGWCHYCGMPAKSFGFFDEPVCRECGG